MATFRMHKTDNYTVMSNYHLRDKELSLKAKGLLSLMLSLPPDWDYSIKGLCAIVKENESAVNSTLKELKQHGYLVVTKLYANQNSTGKIKYIYDVYEMPNLNVNSLAVENLCIEHQYIENPVEINKYRLNKDNKEVVEEEDSANPSDITKTSTPSNSNSINEIDIEKAKSQFIKIADKELVNELEQDKDKQSNYSKHIEDLSKDELVKLELLSSIGRDVGYPDYKLLQNHFNLINIVTQRTPEECRKLIKRKEKVSKSNSSIRISDSKLNIPNVERLVSDEVY